MTIYTMTADGRAWKCDADELADGTLLVNGRFEKWDPMTTNDEQGKHEPLGPGFPGAYLTDLPGLPKPAVERIAFMNEQTGEAVTPTERAPLLRRYNGRGIEDPDGIWVWYNDIQAKITSGELRVVKKATLIPRNGMKRCSVCDYRYEYYEELAPEPGDFCRCGAEIVK